MGSEGRTKHGKALDETTGKLSPSILSSASVTLLPSSLQHERPPYHHRPQRQCAGRKWCSRLRSHGQIIIILLTIEKGIFRRHPPVRLPRQPPHPTVGAQVPERWVNPTTTTTRPRPIVDNCPSGSFNRPRRPYLYTFERVKCALHRDPRPPISAEPSPTRGRSSSTPLPVSFLC